MNREYEEAFAEVEEILKIMPIDLVSKISSTNYIRKQSRRL